MAVRAEKRDLALGKKPQCRAARPSLQEKFGIRLQQDAVIRQNVPNIVRRKMQITLKMSQDDVDIPATVQREKSRDHSARPTLRWHFHQQQARSGKAQRGKLPRAIHPFVIVDLRAEQDLRKRRRKQRLQRPQRIFALLQKAFG